MAEEVYAKLAQALDSRSTRPPVILCDEWYAFAGGLFAVEEAEIACGMSMKSVTVEDLAKQLLRVDIKQLSEELEKMADKGLLRVDIRDGERFYELLPLLPGIIECQFLDGKEDEHAKRVALLWRQYLKAAKGQTEVAPHVTEPASGTRRVIPVNKTVEHLMVVLPYDEAIRVVDEREYVAAGTCPCRHLGDLSGRPCSKPKVDMCMYFGSFAKFIVSRGFAHVLSKEDARQRIGEADRAGLVHTYTDSKNRHTEVMCNCCGCHCPVLTGLNRSPSPGNSAIVNWVITIDDGTCTGCGLCVDRCWMSALKMSDTVVTRDANRCIGCGVCIPECPVDALKLEHRTAC